MTANHAQRWWFGVAFDKKLDASYAFRDRRESGFLRVR